MRRERMGEGNIVIHGAVLPRYFSVLPRYFYRNTDTEYGTAQF